MSLPNPQSMNADVLELLDSFHFDVDGKTIDDLMIPNADGGYNNHLAIAATASLMTEKQNYLYAIGTPIKKEISNKNGKIETILGWVENYDLSTGFYTIRYENHGLGLALMKEDELSRIIAE